MVGVAEEVVVVIDLRIVPSTRRGFFASGVAAGVCGVCDGGWMTWSGVGVGVGALFVLESVRFRAFGTAIQYINEQRYSESTFIVYREISYQLP